MTAAAIIGMAVGVLLVGLGQIVEETVYTWSAFVVAGVLVALAYALLRSVPKLFFQLVKERLPRNEYVE